MHSPSSNSRRHPPTSQLDQRPCKLYSQKDKTFLSLNRNVLCLLKSIDIRYNWPSTAKEDSQFGPSAKWDKQDPPFRLSQFAVDFTHEFPQSKSFMYTKSSHSSTLPCIHVYPDNLKITFHSSAPTRDQIRQFQTQWMSDDPDNLDFINVEAIPENAVHLYICCHGARDQRCGVIGEALISTIRKYIASSPSDLASALHALDVQCFGTSHLGGHQFAGNMIIYRPGWKEGLWYGRVSPCDVDDIFRETIVGGKILGRYWRAGLPSGNWDPKEQISGEEAALRAETWQVEKCGCRSGVRAI